MSSSAGPQLKNTQRKMSQTEYIEVSGDMIEKQSVTKTSVQTPVGVYIEPYQYLTRQHSPGSPSHERSSARTHDDDNPEPLGGSSALPSSKQSSIVSGATLPIFGGRFGDNQN